MYRRGRPDLPRIVQNGPNCSTGHPYALVVVAGSSEPLHNAGDAVGVPAAASSRPATAALVDAGDLAMRPQLHVPAAALCYSGFLFLCFCCAAADGAARLCRRMRRCWQQPRCWPVLSAHSHGLNLQPSWITVGWLVLVAITGQLLGWLLVALCSPRVPSDVSSALLLLTPVDAVGLVVLGEYPSALQFVGCALVLVVGYIGTAQFSATSSVSVSAGVGQGSPSSVNHLHWPSPRTRFYK